MAIYRLSADIVKRSDGRTVTAGAAYRAGELIIDQRTGYVFDYRRRHGVIETAILAPAGAPAWMCDRGRLWNAVEAAEKRKDAQLARDIELALPHELSAETRRELVHRFVRTAFVDAGMVADVAMHAPDARGDGRNFHAHILLTMRRIEGDGFGPKERSWNDQTQLEAWRAQWAALVNDALEIAGQVERVDHRSLAAQGIERLPQIHLGFAVTEMRRRGIATERAELAGAISVVNDGLRAASAEGCNGSARASLPSVLHNTPLALSPRMPARADRLSLFRRASRALTRREKMPARPRVVWSLARAAIFIAGRRAAGRSITKPVSVQRRSRRPRRPRKLAARANMAAEQRLDYLAACDGKITWGWYFAKWGPGL